MNDGPEPLYGYARRELSGAQLVAKDSLVDELSAVINQFGTLYTWARRVQQPRALRGRAPVFVATVPGPKDITVVVRHSWHGGLLAPLTRDVYRRPSRAPVELQNSNALRKLGIPTPELVAYALYAVAPGLVRVDVASSYIPDSYDFAAVLAEHAPTITRTEAFAAIRSLLVQLAQNGFIHPDLNIKNILLYRDAGTVVAAILDVDVMERVPLRHVGKAKLENIARLERSLRKAAKQFGVQMSNAEYEEFIALLRRPLEATS